MRPTTNILLTTMAGILTCIVGYASLHTHHTIQHDIQAPLVLKLVIDSANTPYKSLHNLKARVEAAKTGDKEVVTLTRAASQPSSDALTTFASHLAVSFSASATQNGTLEVSTNETILLWLIEPLTGETNKLKYMFYEQKPPAPYGKQASASEGSDTRDTAAASH